MDTALTLRLGGDISNLRNQLSQASSAMNGFKSQMMNVGKIIGGVFALDKAIDFGKEVFNVTAEFQKFEAVLTNTLGDNGAAKAALAQITDFAAKTPYQVNELTGSFVKLANQGFVPTLDQMRSLGDLASAMGKSFDQLTEAIIDAQTGEFERLKEFGIRASKEGDKVTFTFKGVKTQVDFTADSIRQYVLSLGDVKGVTGGMEAQSNTLGGALSNLADSFDQLKLALGNFAESGGLITDFLNNLGAGTKVIADFFSGPSKEELEKQMAFLEQFKTKEWREKDIDTWYRATEAYQKAATKLRVLQEGEEKLAEIQKKKTIPATDAQAQSVKSLIDQWDRQNSIFGGSKFNPADQIKPKTGADFLFDSGAMATMANAGANSLDSLNKALTINSTAWDVWWSGVQARNEQAAKVFEEHKQRTEELADMAQTIGASIGDAFSEMATGQKNLAQAMLQVTEDIIEMLLRQSIAAMIAAAIKDPSTTAFPFAKIAIAAAGIAAVKGLFNSIGAHSGPSSIGGMAAPGRTPSELNVNVTGGIQLRGSTLNIVLENEAYRKSRVG